MKKIYDMSDEVLTIKWLRIKTLSMYATIIFMLVLDVTVVFICPDFFEKMFGGVLAIAIVRYILYISFFACVLAAYTAGVLGDRLHRIRVWNGCVIKYGLSKAKEMAATETLLNSSQIKELENIATENKEER